MKTKIPVLIAVILNLIVWNYFVSGSWGTFFSLGYFIAIHLAISGMVLLLLWQLARRFLRSNNKPVLLLLSILTAYFPPVIAIWMAVGSLFMAFLVAATSFYFWVPLGLANFFLLLEYSKRVRSLSDAANEVI